MKWNVTENNGGGLALQVWDGGKIVYARTGYEYVPGELKNDIAQLYNTETYTPWDDLDENEAGTEAYEYDNTEHTKIIADGNEEEYTLYIDKMGLAGKKEFC